MSYVSEASPCSKYKLIVSTCLSRIKNLISRANFTAVNFTAIEFGGVANIMKTIRTGRHNDERMGKRHERTVLVSRFVIKIPVFSPTRRATFHFYFSQPPNIEISRVSKIRGRRDAIFTYFPTSSFSDIYERYQFSLPLERSGVEPRKALTGLQRGPRCIATRAPLHCRKAVVATPGGPYGRETVAFQDKINKRKPVVFSAPEEP